MIYVDIFVNKMLSENCIYLYNVIHINGKLRNNLYKGGATIYYNYMQ